jgi:hypothetical protein
MFDSGVVHIFVAGYIVEHYCVMYDRGAFILLWLVILLTIAVLFLTEV